MTYTALFNNKIVGFGAPVYFVAEVSANHNQSLDRAIDVIKAAKWAGANAVKLQTYTADTLTIDSDAPPFRVSGGTLWDGRTLYDLYSEAYTPWEWQGKLKKMSESLGLGFFSSPFDDSSVEFLESIQVESYKIASSEIVDLPLLRRVGSTGKPVMLSCGMATLAEIEEAVSTLRDAGCDNIILLKCTAVYPAKYEELNLLTIRHMATTFETPVGLSDHSEGSLAPIAAVALGACVIEKHLTLRRSDGGPDSGFSMEPEEFKQMVDAVRKIENALGDVKYGPTKSEKNSIRYRRSLFVCRDISKGELLTAENVRSVRPSNGLHPRHFDEVLGKRARKKLRKGTPLDWVLIE